MQLKIETRVIEYLSKQSEFHSINKLKCFAKEEKSFSLYIFSFFTDTQAELLEKYITVRDFIAIYFQSEYIDKEVERWNLYIFFFVRGNVNLEVKYKIEQDKFSSRKIVIDGIQEDITDEFIRNKIEEELFNFKIEQAQEYTETKIDEILKIKHTAVLNQIEKNKKQKISEVELQLIIEELANE